MIRFFDIIFSIFFIFLFSPIFIILIILIFINSGLPILYISKRAGINGKHFRIYKFRTMEITAEEDFHRSHYLDLAKGKEVKPSNSPLEPIRIENDDRITKYGAFLRKTSLDELPNILNVLIGNMSIVGPRPHPMKLNAEYSNKILKFNKRHRYKPGITGLSQISGYSGFISSLSDMNKRVKTDVFYYKNWSFLLDLKIIFKTFLILVKGVLKVN